MIAVIGQGAIGRYVVKHLDEAGLGPISLVMRAERIEDGKFDGRDCVSQVAELPEDTALVIDCGGHEALKAHGAAALRRGMDVITVSLGALATPAVYDELEAAAEEGGAKLHLASGAIGALDAISAACVGGVEEVSYTGRKPPAGWKGSPAEDVIDLDNLTEAATHFEGDAAEAATRYPKNANVAAAVALAGPGMKNTKVLLIADPAAAGNTHEIRAKGAFGEMNFTIVGKGLPENPRSSALAAMSAVAMAKRLASGISI